MEHIKISTPARLHFGLTDMNGESGRIDGGVGLALESPHTVIEATNAQETTVQCRSEPEIESRVADALAPYAENTKSAGPPCASSKGRWRTWASGAQPKL